MKRYLEVFDELASLKSRKERVKLLKDELRDEWFKKFIHYVMSPYLTFGITSFEMEANSGYGADGDFFEFLDELVRREKTGDAARLIMGEYAKKSDEMERIVNIVLAKDLKCGVGPKTLNAACPGLIPVFELCAAEIYDPTDWQNPKMYSLKIDGVRCASICTGPKIFSPLSRNGLVIKNAHYLEPYMTEIYQKFRQPFVIDGEIDYGSLDKTKSLLQRKEYCGIEGKYHVFDILPYEIFKSRGKSSKLIERYMLLEDLIGDWQGTVQLLEHRIANSDAEIQSEFRDVELAGGEGLMVKDPSSLYEFKRTNAWQKLKARDTIDLVVLRAEEGQDRLKGKLGALIVDFNGKEVNIGTGYSDKQRIEFWERMPEVIEVEFHRKTKALSLRDPSFKSVRFDKN